MKKKGQRVGALIGAKDGVVEFLGYGTYEGDFPLPKEAVGFNFGQENPRIKLDNGDVVYGCECWWGEEKTFKEKYIDTAKKIIDVKIGDFRDKQTDETNQSP